MSKFFIDLEIAFRNLVQHTRRTLFLGGAIAAVTMLLILLTGVSTGVRESMIETATTVSTGHVNVGGFYKVTAGQAAPAVTDYEKVIEIVKRDVPEMDFVVHRGRGWAKVVSDTSSEQLGVGGIDIRHEPKFASVLTIVSGKLDDLAQPGTALIFDNQAERLGVKVGDALTYSAPTTRGTNNTIDIRHEPKFASVLTIVSGKLDDLAQPGTALIFDNQAERLGVKVGDALTYSAPTTRGTNNTIDVRVVAIAKSLGLLSSWNTFVPIETLRALYQFRPDTTGVVQIMLKPGAVENVNEIAARLRISLEKAGNRVMTPDPRAFWMKFQSVAREDWTGQKLDVTTWEDEISFITWILAALKGLTGILITILLGIVVIGIMNTMWIAIRERTREIGTLRAIGMQRGAVLWMFLLESLMLGFVGTVAGALAGAGIAAGINSAHIHVGSGMQFILMSDHLHLAVHAARLGGSIALITIITGLAALYPSFRAARLRPVVAMQHFG